MKYKINDNQLDAKMFISFVNKIWDGNYDIKKTQNALSKTINITAYDGDILVGCIRILTDGYFFGTITELLFSLHLKSVSLHIQIGRAHV